MELEKFAKTHHEIYNKIETSQEKNDSIGNDKHEKYKKLIESLSDGCDRYIMSVQSANDYQPMEFTHFKKTNNNHINNDKLFKSDSEIADSYKLDGNQLLKEEKYNEAIIKYTKAIEINPNNAIYYANRAAVYTITKQYGQAVLDWYVLYLCIDTDSYYNYVYVSMISRKATEIDPTYVKAYIREGVAQFNLNQYDRAIQIYLKAIKIVPPSDKANKIIADIKHKISQCQKQKKKNRRKIIRANVFDSNKRDDKNVTESMENVCNHCNKSFSNVSYLRKHIINDHSEKQYESNKPKKRYRYCYDETTTTFTQNKPSQPLSNPLFNIMASNPPQWMS